MRHSLPQPGQHGAQAPERGVGAPPEDEGQYPACGRFFHPPQPPRLALVADKGPHFVRAQAQGPRRVGHVVRAQRRALGYRVYFFFNSAITACVLTPSTRAVSRTPLPFRARSVMRARTPGS